MPQLRKSYTENTVPLTKMSFTPDVPSSALGPNEYNSGYNVETDVRGIRSVNGEEEILQTVPGTPTFVTGGYRQSEVDPLTPDINHKFWFIVACDDGKWYANNGVTGWTEITPGAGTGYSGADYSQSINITDSWNGTVAIFNDTFNAPFFWPDEPGIPDLVMYKNNIPVRNIDTIAVASPSATICTITVDTAYDTAPFAPGDKILISNINNFFNGTFTVADIGGGIGSTTTEIYYYAEPGAAYPGGNVGSVSAAYTWNYNPNWKNLTAGFVRLYSTPNVGNILVAGNLTVTNLDDTISYYPVTIAWSQAFGLNQAPLTWEPTVLNVANQVEVPVRGEVLDAWPSNGQLFLNSYWDTVVLSPLNYSTTSAPILGIRLFNQGRGMLTANCWANSDNAVYGIDARDIWVFNGNTFSGIGNQRVKHWFFDQLDPAYADRVYIECNTEKNQVEIYYPDRDAAAGGVPNRMLSYRYDLDVWNAPRYVSKATYACESPVWTDTYTYPDLSPTNVTGTGAGLELTVTNAGSVYSVTDITNPGSGYAIGNTVKVIGTLLGGTTTANDCTMTVTAINNATGAVTALSASGTGILDWTYNKASRGMVYAKGAESFKLIQKDQGYTFVDDTAINSSFRRDNMKLVKDYSTKTLVHRVLPEAINLKDDNIEIDPVLNPELIGNIKLTIEGANSVGQSPQYVATQAMSTDTDYPWIQINQNAHRVNSIEITDDETTPGTIWMCNAITFQYTETEDDR